jgi:predicted transcriptional regulator
VPEQTSANYVDLAADVVSAYESVQPEYIVCLEDGKKFQSLKRHLRKFDMTPANYASRRSELAKAIGLGQARKGKPSKKRAAAA